MHRTAFSIAFCRVFALALSVTACGNVKDFVKPRDAGEPQPPLFTPQDGLLESSSFGMKLHGDRDEQSFVYLAAIKGEEFALIRVPQSQQNGILELVHFGTVQIFGNELKTSRLFGCDDLRKGAKTYRDFYFTMTGHAEAYSLQDMSNHRLLADHVSLERTKLPAALSRLRTTPSAQLPISCVKSQNGPRDEQILAAHDWFQRAAQLFE